VGTYAELLRHERWFKGSLTDAVIDLAHGAAGAFADDPGVEEFILLLDTAGRLAPDE
jgi:hypothetical protein